MDAILYHPDLTKYSFGEGHPFTGERFEKFFNFFRSCCWSFQDEFTVVEPQIATDELLELVHTREYIEAIRSASEGKVVPDIYRYVSSDNLNPYTGCIPRKIEEGAKIIVGICCLAGELVAEGRFSRAIGIGGGMHHAKPDYGEGFCFYNDVAICIKNLQQKYRLQKILVLDTDAHAGNGTKEIFYDDPKVLFIDIHQDPATLYPGTGFTEEIGRGKGEGFTVNLPVLPGAGNKVYEYLFEEFVFPLAREFQPQAIIRYGGSDPHYLDTLTNLGLTLEGFKRLGQKVRALAAEFTDGRSIDLLLSGYNLGILPFAWSALLAGLVGLNMDLGDLKEASPYPPDFRLKETQDMAKRLKRLLKKYWRCMEG